MIVIRFSCKGGMMMISRKMAAKKNIIKKEVNKDETKLMVCVQQWVINNAACQQGDKS